MTVTLNSFSSSPECVTGTLWKSGDGFLSLTARIYKSNEPRSDRLRRR
jgi:hypothetical protein